MRKTFLVVFLLFIYSIVSAQQITVQQYIDTYKDIAIREMKRMGIPASITLAQGILETENGNGVLVKKSNNHFGIKCKSSWSGDSVSHDDDANGECFRKYNTAEESYRDHSNFLRGSDRYSFLFKLSPTDYKGWAYGLKKAGYATNPSYPEILIKSIEDYNLQQYTLMAINDVPVFEAAKYASDKEEVQKDATPGNNDGAALPVVTNDKTTINGLKVISATKGTSLLAIATDNHIALSKLLEYNDMKEDGLLAEDQWIYLERKLAKGNHDFYITGKEETINHIAQANAIQLAYILKYNPGIKEDEIVKQGIKIFLRPDLSDNDLASNANIKTHVVQPKEGLYAISRKYNVTVQQIREWNHLASDELQIGQKLIISK